MLETRYLAHAARLGPGSGVGIDKRNGNGRCHLRCGECHQDSSYAEHNFLTSQFAIVWLIAGSGHIRYGNNEPWQLADNSIFLRLPGQAHDLELWGSSHYAYLAVPSQVFDLFTLSGLILTNTPVFSTSLGPDTLLQWQRLTIELQSCPESDLTAIIIKMQDFAHGVLQSRQLLDKASDNASTRDIVAEAGLLLQGRESVPKIAEKLGLNYHVFRREFKRLTGSSPGDWRLRKRIERSCQFLIGSEHSISEIAELLDYPDVYSFSSQFKKCMGCSPSEYRRGF